METTLQIVIIEITVPTIAEIDFSSISAIIARWLTMHVVYRQVFLTFLGSKS